MLTRPATVSEMRGEFRWIVVGTIGLVLAILMVSLRWQGHPWWCRLGDYWPGSLSIHDTHTSQHLIDPYSLTHVLHGLLMYAGLWLFARRWRLDVRLLLTVMLESGWEFVENSPMIIERYRAGTIALGYVGDSVINSLGDVAACGLGFFVAGWLSVRASVRVFLVVEIGLLLAYRDNLLLNVIMLLHSFESIRTWQAAG